MQESSAVSPKDKFVTVYGRKPVLEALADSTLTVDKIMLADNVRGAAAAEIQRAARAAGVPLHRASAHRVKVLAGNGKQEQGVLADIVAPRMRPLGAFLDSEGLDREGQTRDAEGPSRLLLLDGITTPANVGMILRTATAAGVDGIVVPRHGVASLDPLVVKASAGVAFKAPILRCGSASEGAEALAKAGYSLLALGASAKQTVFEAAFPSRVVFILGGETNGVSPSVAELVDQWLSIPMRNAVESLNVAAAAAIVSFELLRRSLPQTHEKRG